MARQLPQELIDLVINLLPLDISLNSIPDYRNAHNLVNCTLVSRSFSRPARHRLFAKIKVGRSSDFNLLQTILEDGYIRLSVRFLHVVIDDFEEDGDVERHDSELADIIGALASCNVRHLLLKANFKNAVLSEKGFRYSMPSLKKLVTHLEVLTLQGDMTVASSLLEHKSHLKRLQILGSTLGEISVVQLLQTQIDELFIRPGNIVALSSAPSGLPTFTAARIEISNNDWGRDPITSLLFQSSHSLHALEIIALRRSFPTGVDFSSFQNLRTLRYCAEFGISARLNVLMFMMVFLGRVAEQFQATQSSSIEELDVKLTVLKETNLSTLDNWVENPETEFHMWRNILKLLEPTHLRSTLPRLRSLRILVDLHQLRQPRRFARISVADWAFLEDQVAAHLRRQIIGAVFGDPEATLPTTSQTTCEIDVTWMAAEPSRVETSYHWKS